MPIDFPPADIGPDWIWPGNVGQGVFASGPSVNPGSDLDFEAPEFSTGSRPNPVPAPVVDPNFSVLQYGAKNYFLTGVSRDAFGVALASCKVMVFRAEDKSFVAETVSDGIGNWSICVMQGGPFFLVQYKAGVPDYAGTSVNTLVPT